jgi:N-acetylmuramoyl-L-alanine amidase
MSLSIVQRPSPNFTAGRKSTDFLVIHSTASNSGSGALTWLCNPKSKSSAHYLIDRDGSIYQFVDEANAAWHAGRSRYNFGNEERTDLNSYSIGIECVADVNTPYTTNQFNSLVALCNDIVARHKIRLEYVLRHKDVAYPRGRKSDVYPLNMDWNVFKALLKSAPAEVTPPVNNLSQWQVDIVQFVKSLAITPDLLLLDVDSYIKSPDPYKTLMAIIRSNKELSAKFNAFSQRPL